MIVPRVSVPELLLRASLAFSFIYPPIAALIKPYDWVGYIPTALQDIVAPHTMLFLHGIGIIEIGLALWIMFGKRIFAPSVVAGAFLIAIVIMNPTQFDILFRDVSLVGIALALIYLHRPKKHHGT